MVTSNNKAALAIVSFPYFSRLPFLSQGIGFTKTCQASISYLRRKRHPLQPLSFLQLSFMYRHCIIPPPSSRSSPLDILLQHVVLFPSLLCPFKPHLESGKLQQFMRVQSLASSSELFRMCVCLFLLSSFIVTERERECVCGRPATCV